VADNGPNLGDRLLDWSGAYNLYTHCNSAYGGFNDVRQFSPDMQNFLQRWAYGGGRRPDAQRRADTRDVGVRRARSGVPGRQHRARDRAGVPGHARALRQPERVRAVMMSRRL
jgi:hypothetical protein